MIIRFTTILFCSGISLTASAQSDTSVILGAMRDEMQRNLKELASDADARPFYIAFSLRKTMVRRATSSLGSKATFNVIPGKNSNVRLLVGTNDLNDESFDSSTEMDGSFDAQRLPLDNDYLALRRLFWQSTDNVYRRASKFYKENKKYFEKQTANGDTILYKRFASVETFRHSDPLPTTLLSDQELKDIAEQASALFKPYPNVFSSTAAAVEGWREDYFVNSEGTQVIECRQTLSLVLNFKVTLSNGEVFNDLLTYVGRTMDDLPSIDTLSQYISRHLKNMESFADCAKLQEAYNGPTLFMDGVFASMLGAGFTGSFKASSPRLSNTEKQKKPEPTAAKKMEDRIGERLVSPLVGVEARPRTRIWQGRPVLGGFVLDSEGVPSPESFLFISKGELKNVTQQRNTLKPSAKPTGTNHTDNVLLLTSENTKTHNQLIKELKKCAKKDKLKEAVLIRKSVPGSRINMMYLFDIKTGKETMVRSATQGNINYETLDQFIGASGTLMVYNFPNSNDINSSSTLIAPDTVLLRRQSITPRSSPEIKKPVVPSPLVARD